MLQDYIRELAICLAVGGDSLCTDLNNASGHRLTQLHGELCGLCSAKARLNLQAHRDFMSRPLLPMIQGEGALSNQEPDWLDLGVSPSSQYVVSFACYL